MKCPNCKDKTLIPYMTSQGVEINICSSCKGTWLDKGEILSFSKNPKKLEEALNESLVDNKVSKKNSPRTNQKMVTFTLEDSNIELDYCLSTGGLWLDSEEFTKLVNFSNVNLAIEKPITFFKQKFSSLPSIPLVKLPNLFYHSLFSIFSLYFILGLLLISVFEYFQISQIISLYIILATFILSVLFAPKLMDWSISFFYSAQEVNIQRLPQHLQAFITQITLNYQIKIPIIYIIDDEAPQAFTYGYTPNTARLVFSKGLYTLLNEDEIESVIAHEFGHIVHWDMALMTVIQLVPQISYSIYKFTIENKKKSSSSNKNNGGQAAIIGVFAYIIYFVSQYVVLWFSRIREYHADRFSASYTKSPVSLANALVKIGYGLAMKQTNNSQGINALGIYDAKSASSFAILGFRLHEKQSFQTVEDVKDVMKWDFWNP